jgi:hypothetical protein
VQKIQPNCIFCEIGLEPVDGYHHVKVQNHSDPLQTITEEANVRCILAISEKPSTSTSG